MQAVVSIGASLSLVRNPLLLPMNGGLHKAAGADGYQEQSTQQVLRQPRMTRLWRDMSRIEAATPSG